MTSSREPPQGDEGEGTVQSQSLSLSLSQHVRVMNRHRRQTNSQSNCSKLKLFWPHTVIVELPPYQLLISHKYSSRYSTTSPCLYGTKTLFIKKKKKGIYFSFDLIGIKKPAGVVRFFRAARSQLGAPADVF